ncbi:uncharacterized protein KIAA1143 homolog [Gigantopelta aegis]|uniref:uncharacterized protein KIAA1143 homolog n=1 Tax=Gigantopelta aegis TaxID=1735272 RepID=UPI001B88A8A1|nr:uncharacterized protein KIAA1143 homolog [Gigantopelta aegis]
MSGRGKKAHGVQYVQNEEPAFIRQFKEKIGYKEGPDVDTKRQRLESDEEGEDQDSHDDEKPVVVVLKEGDLTAEEVDKLEELEETKKTQADSTKPKDGKILFTKPTKRDGDAEKTSELSVSSAKKAKKEEKKDKKSLVKEVRNSNLLSFDDEDEDDT